MLKLFKSARANEGRGDAGLIFHPECRQLGGGNTVSLSQTDHFFAYLYARLGDPFGIDTSAKRAA